MKKCKYLYDISNEDWRNGIFLGIFQRSKIIEPSPLAGGHNGGVLQYPVAVIEDENGLLEIEVWRVKEVEE